MSNLAQMNSPSPARRNDPGPHRSSGIIRCVIADDERLARQKLRVLLEPEHDVEVVAECSNGKETIEAIRTHRPDLLLLDIQMPDLDGFQVLNAIPPRQMPVVIFATAYDQYAIKAFEAHALDYLLKPFDQERFRDGLNRVRMALARESDSEFRQRVLNLIAGAKPTAPEARRLVVRAGGRVVFLDYDEIEWIEAAANYVRLHAGKEVHMLRGSIGHLAETLDPSEFVRVHRSTIVNVRCIKELQPCNSGEFIVVLRSGKQLSCSRGYRAGLQEFIGKKTFP
jgi:two-component system LytT family response regulator